MTMSNEEILNKLKKYLVFNEYKDIYVIKRENLPFLSKELYRLFDESNSNKIRENCSHEFGNVEWLDSCNGKMVCRKCGYEQWVYERD